jgi:hypothetical protein
MTKPVFTHKRIMPITDYPQGALGVTEVVKKARLSDGNTVAVCQDGRVYNVHPLTDLYQQETGGYVYPIRWQLSQWDLTQEIVDKLDLDFDLNLRG